MDLYYKKPFLQEDGKIVVDQVTEFDTEEIAHGILKREIHIVQELYPNIEILNLTISQAEQNYSNLEMQGDKSVAQLEAEKKALSDLKEQVLNLTTGS